MKARTFVLVLCLVSIVSGRIEVLTHDGLDGFVAGEHYLQTDTIPSGPTDTGVAGTIAWNDDFIFFCVADNTWRRAAIETWGVDIMIYENEDRMLYEDGDTMIYE